MTVNPSIDPARLLEEQLAQASPDLLRELLGTFINTLLSAEADAVCGAEYGTRTPDRVNRRNGYRHRDATNEHATAVRNLEPDPWLLGDEPTRPLRAHGAVLGDLADLRRSARWIGLPASLAGAPHHRFRVFITAYAKALFRTPLASDSSRGGETLDQVRARRDTIALSHQVIDLALHGPHGSPASWNESETLFALIEAIFTAGGDTPTPSPDGNTSPNEPPLTPRS